MKLPSWRGNRAAYALLLVMGIVAVAAITAASSLKRTYTISNLNQRNKQYVGSLYAAEAAVESVYSRILADYQSGGEAAVTNNLANYRLIYPSTAQNSYWSGYQFWDAQGNNNRTYVTPISIRTFQQLDGNYAGLSGWRTTYRTVSNARPLDGLHQVGAGVLQDVAMNTIPAFQFAIFYNGQLEFTWCAPLVVRGRTHANGPICLGPPSSSSLVFDGTVTTSSSILKSNLGGYTVGNMTGPVTYNGNPKTTEFTPTLQLPIGTNNTPAAVREIVNLPPAGESVTSSMGLERFANKAAVVVLVSNNTVTVTVKDKGNALSTGVTTNYSWAFTNMSQINAHLPFVRLTNVFRDMRESKWVMPTQIDMGLLKTWLVTNSVVTNRYPHFAGGGPYPNVMYVADFRSLTNLHAVRLTNGVVIPTNGPSHDRATGFTVATPNPLYVWGHYNTPNTAHRGTTNTSASFPASFISDAITILSPNWQDSQSNLGYTSRVAANTTVNSAILAGSVYSTGSATGQWSGGVHNLPRLLEHWTGRTLTLNTSLVNLYNSVRANTQFQNPGVYYSAPTRNFNFDQNFLNVNKLPPATPTVSVIQRLQWTVVAPNTVTYAGP